MSTIQPTAGTGNETASQATAQVAGTSASPQAQPQQQPGVGAQEAGQPAAQTIDPLAALLPKTPEEAAKAGAEVNGKTEEARKEGDPAPDAPLDIKIPDGYRKDEALMQGFMDVAKKSGLKQEAAQQLFDMHVQEQKKAAQVFEKSILDQRARINAEWARACRNDPEFGGEKYESSCNHAIQAIRRFTPNPIEQAEFVKFYQAAGLESAHPMWRFLVRVGMDTAEAGPMQSEASRPIEEKSLADRLFPNFPSAKQ